MHRFRYFVRSIGDTRGGNEDLGSFNVEVHERGIARASSGIVQHILESDEWKVKKRRVLAVYKTWLFHKGFRLRRTWILDRTLHGRA